MDEDEIADMKAVPNTDQKKREEAGRRKALAELNDHLQLYYERNVVKSLERKTKCEDMAYIITYKIIRRVQMVDSRFRAKSLVTLGIPYDGMYADKDIYLEMMLQLSLGSNNSVYLVRDKTSHFARIQPYAQEIWHDCMDSNKIYISPKLVIKLLRRYLKRAVNVLNQYMECGNKYRIPINLTSIEMEKGHLNTTLVINGNIRVRVLPSLSIPDCRNDLTRKDLPSSSHVVAVPKSMMHVGDNENAVDENNVQNTNNAGDNNIVGDKNNEKNSKNFGENIGDNTNVAKLKETRIVWKYSFFVAEKNKMRKAVEGCRIKLLRILTEIRDSDSRLHGLSSEHLKTIFFHEIDRINTRRDWNETKLSHRFLSIIRRISLCLQDESCPCYFMQPPDFPILNLFKCFSKTQIEEMLTAFDEILADPIKVLELNLPINEIT